MKQYTNEEIEKVYRELNIQNNLPQIDIKQPEIEVRIVNY